MAEQNFKVKNGIDIGVANGTAPLTTNSTTVVSNLNADMLDGLHSTAFQPVDADLTAIAALAGTTGLLKKTATDTWTLDTTAYTTNLGTVTAVTASGSLASSGGTTPAISHLTSDGNLHVPATGTTNSGKVLTAGATAGSLSWTTPTVGTVTSVTGTAPVVSSGGATPAISMAAATALVNGYMTSTYASKLDGIAAGAQVNVATNLSATAGTTAGPTINSSTGTNVVIPSASATESGIVTTGAQTFAGVKTLTSPVLITPSIGVATGTSFNAITGLASVAPLIDGTATVGVSTLTARQDHVHPTDTSRSPLAGSASITTLGTIATGTWSATTIATAKGGTGTTTAPVAGGVIYGASTSAYGTTTAGTAGYILASGGAGAPTWVANDLTSFPSSSFKKSVRVATTVALTLNAATASIDDITLSAADRVLIKNQAAPAQNGIYYNVTTTTWVRSAGSAISAEIANALVAVDEGTVNGGQYFSTTFKPTDTLGTTAMNWYLMSLAQTSGSTVTGSPYYNGTTALAGSFDGGATTPTGTTRLNYGGYFYPTYINLVGSADTATAASHYFVETGSDGYVRPKTLANVKTEIVTAAAVTAAVGVLSTLDDAIAMSIALG